jgi:16S rRNA (guanine527-N7)-methyltransferase
MSASDLQQLGELLSDFSDETREKVLSFYQLLAAENQVQNLTRLISPADFWSGHLIDVLELQKTGWVDYPAVDLGSGCGVPGLLSALVEPQEWCLVESEKRKAEFLDRVVRELKLESLVTVRAERLESYLRAESTCSIVARAVGPVERIFSWIVKRSTWNNLVLLKGPGWDNEWEAFQKGRFKGQLEVSGIHSYRIEKTDRERKIVKLVRSLG